MEAQESDIFGCLLLGWSGLALSSLLWWVPKTPVKRLSFVGVGLSEIVLTIIQPIVIAVPVSVLRCSWIQLADQPTTHRGPWKTKERRKGRNTTVVGALQKCEVSGLPNQVSGSHSYSVEPPPLLRFPTTVIELHRIPSLLLPCTPVNNTKPEQEQ